MGGSWGSHEIVEEGDSLSLIRSRRRPLRGPNVSKELLEHTNHGDLGFRVWGYCGPWFRAERFRVSMVLLQVALTPNLGYCPHPVTVYIRGPIKGYIYNHILIKGLGYRGPIKGYIYITIF